MTYEEAIDYIGSISSFGIKLGMERIVSLLSHLDDPQKFLKVIHVAGTNGKGSFGTFLSEILMASGYKVGRYISPALYDYRERIQINGQYISKEAVSGYIEKIRKICLQMTAGGEEHPTVFEVETAMALMYFWDMDCDYVVLEVGMGGRLDSTNVIDEPLLSVITSISKDHTQALGDTLEAIAGEKAGIIKEGCPVLAYDQAESVIKVLRTQAQQRHAPLILTDWTALCVSGTSIQGQTFDYQALHGLTIHMAGIYQVYNAAAAVQAALLLEKGGIPIRPEAIYDGLRAARWPGRFEIIKNKPVVIVDGAHNPGGAAALAKSIETYFKGRKLIGVMGVFADKDYVRILERLLPYFKTLYTHCPKNARGLASNELAAAAKAAALRKGLNVRIIDGGQTEEACKMAFDEAEEEDVIAAFGSLSTVKTVSETFKALKKEGDMYDR